MFVVTDSAKQELNAFFEGKEKSPVRVYLAAGGCSGPRLALALDQSRDTDECFNEQGFEFCMEKSLYEKAQGVTIDTGYMGFIVNSEAPVSDAKSGCASCSCGCGH